ncbi:MAG: hypothetical protein SRB2_03416 [Desulfobacteraceae bacterium Eth-SRB2]|nr:MAG: hypothetical protein SRB2_03416 [Desulfobacteraceae bacterium Eth-SRB2]
MAHMSLTALRNKLFKVVDEIIKTGIPVEIEKNNHKLLIVLKEKKSKLHNLKPHDCIIGDPDDLVNLKVTEWDEVNNL